MIEKLEFLIAPREAVDIGFPPTLGRVASLWRLVTVSPGDKVFEMLRKCEQKWVSEGRLGHFARGWKCRRLYKPAELAAAELFRLLPKGLDSEAASDQSVYDVSPACPHCGAGRKQIADLVIDHVRLPKSRHIVHTIGTEWLFRKELADALEQEGFSGLRFRPVVHRRDRFDMPIDLKRYPTGRKILELAAAKGGFRSPSIEFDHPDLWPQLKAEHQEAIRQAEARASRKPSAEWVQLEVTSKPVQTCPPTEFGVNCFDRDEKGRYRCPEGHTSGLHLLTEVWIKRADWDGADLVATTNLYGQRAGYFVPEPALLISPRLYRFLSERKVKGAGFEVAHLV